MAPSETNRPNAKTIESITYVDPPALGSVPAIASSSANEPGKIRGNANTNFGHNAQTDLYEDLVAAGVGIAS